jgi:hypothetical protein
MQTLFLFTRTLQRSERARTRTIIALKCAGNGKLARLAAIIRCTARWAMRSFFDFFTLALRALRRFNGCKATRRRRCGIRAGFFSDRFKCFRRGRRCCSWRRRRRSRGFLTIGLRTLALFFCALRTLLGFTAAAFFQHGQTRFFGFAK